MQKIWDRASVPIDGRGASARGGQREQLVIRKMQETKENQGRGGRSNLAVCRPNPVQAALASLLVAIARGVSNCSSPAAKEQEMMSRSVPSR